MKLCSALGTRALTRSLYPIGRVSSFKKNFKSLLEKKNVLKHSKQSGCTLRPNACKFKRFACSFK